MTQIKWSDKPNKKTLLDSYLIYELYKKPFKMEISFINNYNEFLEMYKCCSKIETVDISTLNNIKNSRHTIKGKTPEDYYPITDRPRGDNDINSVKYHMTTKKYVSPIIILNINKRRIKLDGVHRLIGAKLRNSKVRVCEIFVPKSN